MRQADLLQLEQIAAGYSSRDRFLTKQKTLRNDV
jgi:hypothetical protein